MGNNFDLFRDVKPLNLADQDENLRAGTIWQSDFLKRFFEGEEISFYEIMQFSAMFFFAVIGMIIKGGIFTYGTTLSQF